MHVTFAYKDWEVTCCPVVVTNLLLFIFLKNALLQSYLLNNLWYVYIPKHSFILHYDCGVALLLLVIINIQL